MQTVNPNESKRLTTFVKSLSVKEVEDDIIITGLAATTHPDRTGDILSIEVMNQIANNINDMSKVGGDQIGATRGVSLGHDWIYENDTTKDWAGFIKPTARVVDLDDGHKGVEIEVELNKYYKGNVSIDEIKYRLDNGYYSGFSIEYEEDKDKSSTIKLKDKDYNYINHLNDFSGVGIAHARLQANPYAVAYKEIAEHLKVINKQTKEGEIMVEEEKPKDVPEVKAEVKEAPAKEVKEPEVKEVKEEPKLDVKQVLDSDEFQKSVKEIMDKSKDKPMKQTKEDITKMETKEVSLSVKEVTDGLKRMNDTGDTFQVKEAGLRSLRERDDELKSAYRSTGIVLNPTLQMKCVGTKLRIVPESIQFQTKDTLDTTTNTTTYTQNIVEMADVYIPGLVDTFNNQTNLFGALRKVNHIEGGDKYGWRNATNQGSGYAVDPGTTTVVKENSKKVKLQTKICEYRGGVSVSEYTLYHSRASMGDLFMIEVEKRMKDIMQDVDSDLFGARADTTVKMAGLPGFANSGTYTSLYGLTRSTTNRLSPVTASSTYIALGAAITEEALRARLTILENAGAMRQNLRIVCAPNQRDAIYNEMSDKKRYIGTDAALGFSGNIPFDGIPILTDHNCPTDSIFIYDDESYYIVVSKGPTVQGLAKVGAADEAYISMYMASVYENPLRVYWIDSLLG